MKCMNSQGLAADQGRQLTDAVHAKVQPVEAAELVQVGRQRARDRVVTKIKVLEDREGAPG